MNATEVFANDHVVSLCPGSFSDFLTPSKHMTSSSMAMEVAMENEKKKKRNVLGSMVSGIVFPMRTEKGDTGGVKRS